MLREITEGKADKNKEFLKLQKSIKSVKSIFDSFEEEFRIIVSGPDATNGEWIDEKEDMIYKYENSLNRATKKVADIAYKIL